LLVYCYYDIGDYCADCTMAIDEEIGEEDSDTLREWYELDDEDRAEWLRNHPDPF